MTISEHNSVDYTRVSRMAALSAEVDQLRTAGRWDRDAFHDVLYRARQIDRSAGATDWLMGEAEPEWLESALP